MQPLQAVGLLAHHHAWGDLALPACLLADGTDLNVEFTVALAVASGRLAPCRTLSDVVNAAVLGGADYADGTLDHALLENTLAEIVSLVEQFAESAMAELN